MSTDDLSKRIDEAVRKMTDADGECPLCEAPVRGKGVNIKLKIKIAFVSTEVEKTFHAECAMLAGMRMANLASELLR